MNLCDFLLYSSENDTVPALIDPDGRICPYGHLRSTIGHLAGFIEQATAPQDRCLIVAGGAGSAGGPGSTNAGGVGGAGGFFWIAAYLAIIKAGRIAVPVPVAASADRLERIARSCVPALAFIQAAQMPMLTKLVRPGMAVVTDGPIHRTNAITWTEALAYPPMNRSRPTSSDMLAALSYTANRSDELRGIMLTHGNIIAAINALLHCIPLRHADRTLCMAPLTSCLGAAVLHAHLRAGASLVLRPPPFPAERVPEHLEEYRCTTLAGSAATLHHLLQFDLATRPLPYLRAIQVSDERPSPSLLEDLRRTLRGKPIYTLHGQPETTGLYAYLRPEKLEYKPTSIGKGIAEISLAVLDPAGRPVLPGEIGHLVVQGPTIALGYWRDPAGSRRAFRGGQFHTGELARVDRDGDVYLVAQADDPSNVDGFPPLQCPVREVHYAALNFGLSEDSNATRLPFYWEEDDLREPEDHPR